MKFVRMRAGNTKYNNKQKETRTGKEVKRSEKPIKLKQNRVVMGWILKLSEGNGKKEKFSPRNPRHVIINLTWSR